MLSESAAVTSFAADLGAEVLESSATGLNEAVQLAYERLAERFERVVIAHGDLRHPDGLGGYRPESGVTVFSDHHGTGTNVLALPTGLDFHFQYGPDSAALHVREAERLRLPWRLVADSPWRFDVDEPADLRESALDGFT